MSGADSQPPRWSPFEVLTALGLGLLLAVAVATALVGGLAGAMFGDGWVGTPLADALSVFGRLRHHLGDPRQAWPAADRSGLPGAAGFYATVILLAGACTSIVVIAIRARGGLTSPRRGSTGLRTRSTRWASPRDLAPLAARQAPGGRVVLGTNRGRLVAAEAGQSVIVVAPTQTGKTTGLAVPALLEWEGPVLATSVKNDLLRDTFARRDRLGEVKVFDPTATTGMERASWTPLAGCHDWQGARRTADRLAKAAQPSTGLRDADFWFGAAARFLAPLLLAAATSGRSMADVVRWIDSDEQAEISEALAGSELRPARDALMTVWTADERLRSSVYVTASLALDAYNDPTVLACSNESAITPSWLLDGRANTLYLCAPADEQSRLCPLFVTLVRQIVSEVYGRAAGTGRPIEPSLLVVLDEAPNIAPLPDLDQLASTGAGQGLQLVTVVQDLAQVRARWGAKADSIVNNHRAKLFGPGLSCATTLGYVSRVLGEFEQRQTSTTTGEKGRRSTTKSTTYRALATADVLRESQPGSMLLVYGHLPPAWIELRPWFADRALRSLSSGGAERNAARRDAR